jgi:ribonuclease HI
VYEKNSIKNFVGMNKKTTNNQMELKAVNEALAFSLLKNYREIEILTDSAYVVNTINFKMLTVWKKNKWKTKNNEDIKNKKEWKRFCKLISELKRNNASVKFTKIKSHSNNHMNDKADILAKKELAKFT